MSVDLAKYKSVEDQLLVWRYPTDFGIIFTRHVNSVSTDRYWKETIRCIREHYPDQLIVLIDDNSKPEFLTEENTVNIIYIQSEYPGTGELLPYFYFYKYRFFKRALIIHDSVFLQSPPSLEEIRQIQTVQFLWTIPHWYNCEEDIFSMIQYLINPSGLIHFYRDKKWTGCFGAQSIIHYDFLEKIEQFELFELLYHIKTRENRMSLERIFGMLCHILDPNLHKKPSLYGNICDYNIWGYTFDRYIEDKKTNLPPYPMLKVWTSR